MISYLDGILVQKSENNIVIEVNGIGYEVLTNKKTVLACPKEGEKIKIYTSLIHKEDSMILCGFSRKDDRDLFKILLTVSGVGLKVALAILDLDTNEIISAIVSENDKVFSSIKGIGQKLSKRLILELKDKMTKYKDDFNIIAEDKNSVDYSKLSDGFLEAQSVMLSLGYTVHEIQEGFKFAETHVKNINDTQEILQIALSKISGN